MSLVQQKILMHWQQLTLVLISFIFLLASNVISSPIGDSSRPDSSSDASLDNKEQESLQALNVQNNQTSPQQFNNLVHPEQSGCKIQDVYSRTSVGSAKCEQNFQLQEGMVTLTFFFSLKNNILIEIN